MSELKEQVSQLKEEGNQAFKSGDYKQAIRFYSDAIEACGSDCKDDEVLKEYYTCHNNRAQCYLNSSNYDAALNDCQKVLYKNANDTKALLRRSKAYKGMNKYEEALRDAKLLISIDKGNKAAIEHIQSLTKFIQEKSIEQNSVKIQAKNMLDLVLNNKGETQINALNNLIVLARENAASDEIFAIGTLPALKNLVSTSENTDVILAIARIYASLCKNSPIRSQKVYNALQFEHIAKLIAHKLESISTAASLIVQNIIYAITDLENKRKHVKKQVNEPHQFSKEVHLYIEEIFRCLLEIISDPNCSGHGRDNCIDLCLKFVDTANGCGWTSKFVAQGVPKLLKVASSMPELSGTLPITEHTKMHIACCLSTVYDDLYSDKARDEYINECDKYIQETLEKNDDEAKIKTVAAVAVLLQGPFDVGNAIIGKNNLIDLMLSMAGSNDMLQEAVAVEAVVLTASKKDKASGMLSLGLDVLKKLYNSTNKKIKVRALVGLCKLASSKGNDASIKLLAEGSILKLEKACRKFLCLSADDYDTKKWAADGLAYLTLDADVKEEFVNDLNAVQALYSLTKKDDKNTLYSVATVLANVCNAYEVKKPDPEMIELAKYAKHHIPEENVKDKPEFLKARRQKLMESGISQALVSISKHNSNNCKELISWIFCVLCEEPKNRGAIVAAGGGKVLIPMALEGTQNGKTKAAQALAKVSISINPEIAFPGQRCVEVVRPLIGLLHPDKSALENFEALMGLTNLAQVNKSVRKAMMKEFSNIEQYIYDEHPLLRRASVECMCNLVQEEDAAEYFRKDNNDRVKLMVLYLDNEDMPTSMASAGVLCQLSNDKVICQKVLEVKSFVEIFKQSACSAEIEFQFRVFYILRNLVDCDKEIATKIVESEIMDVIAGLTRIEVEPQRVKVQEVANEIMKKVLEYELIKPKMSAFIDTIPE